MKILVVHYSDDNFGDILIRNCFEQIMKVVLDNIGMKPNEYEIYSMGVKNPNIRLIEEAQLICFAGGGLFGLCYLDFYSHMKQILDIANKLDIPAIFSSIGVNNMDANSDNDNCLSDLLDMKCIKAIAVRENPELFRKYAGDTKLNIKQVCDPAVWTKYVYASVVDKIIEAKQQSDKKVVGINVVRGGLFIDNDKKWYLTNEANYLNELKQLLEKEGYECKFYTNGSTLDNNAMLFLENKFNIPEDQMVFVDSTKELVETIASFDMVAAIRMHSSIISYAMDIPVVNLVWNDKIPHFYDAINRKKDAIQLEDWNATNVYSALKELDKNDDYHIDISYLMTLYDYLYDSLSDICNKEDIIEKYSFEQITAKLKTMSVSEKSDINDMKVKLYRGEKRYFGQYMKLRKSDADIKKFKSKIEAQNSIINEKDEIINNTELSLKKSEQKVHELQKRLDRIDSMLIIRVYKKNKRIMKKVKETYCALFSQNV